jgi:hypothetical protein
VGRLQTFFGARVEIGGDIKYLRIGERKRGHAFINAAEANDFTDLVTFDVMR